MQIYVAFQFHFSMIHCSVLLKLKYRPKIMKSFQYRKNCTKMQDILVQQIVLLGVFSKKTRVWFAFDSTDTFIRELKDYFKRFRKPIIVFMTLMIMIYYPVYGIFFEKNIIRKTASKGNRQFPISLWWFHFHSWYNSFIT